MGCIIFLPNTIDKKLDQRIGHRNQIIFPIGMQPGIDDLIDRADDKALDQPDIEVFANRAVLLPLLDDLGDEIPIHLGHFLDLRFRQAAVLMGFNLVDDRPVSVALKFRQVAAHQVAQFVQAGLGPIDRLPETFKYLFGPKAEKLNQNVVFIFKIQVNGAVGDPGFFGNLGNGGLMKSLSGKNLNRRLKDLMIFMIFFDPVRGCPQRAILSK